MIATMNACTAWQVEVSKWDTDTEEASRERSRSDRNYDVFRYIEQKLLEGN